MVKEKDINYYWVEVSGVVESLFRHYDGYYISNTSAPNLLNKPIEDFIFDEDGVHYERYLSEEDKINNTLSKKVIIGINYEETYNKIIDILDGLEEFKRVVCERHPNINGSSDNMDNFNVNLIFCILDKILEEYQDNKIVEFPPRWHFVIDSCLDYLQNLKYTSKDIEYYLNVAKLLFKVPEITLNRIED